MKNIVILTTLLAISSSLFAQEMDDYMFIMVKQKKAFKMARNEQDFLNLANSFERIANAESDKWHPLYYAGFSYINMSFINQDNAQKDAYLDKAQTYIDKAFEIYPDESELYVIQALIYQGRIQIDPVQRGMVYASKATESLTQALEYNPDNPRAYYLLGLNVLHTPEAFGGGATNACVNFKKAMDLFGTYIPEHVLSPSWGGERNQQLFSQNCTGLDKE